MAAVPPRALTMIGFLRGTVLEKAPERLLVDVHGVGYELRVPLSTFYQVGEAGAEVALRVHTHVREEALQLFGFLTSLELQVFEHLIGISGIGPKLAIAVLSGIEPADLVGAVQRGDVSRLTRVPGVGKKTAERIVLELKDRLDRVEMPAASRPAAGAPGRVRDDLLSALVNLGYHRAAADKALDAVLAAAPDAPFEQALRAALRELMK
ncbi:MAG: Holliday junction branch migration protein RuvA [Vicinamibacterales bacterium]